MSQATPEDTPDIVVSDEARHKAEEFIEAEEGAANKLTGWLGVFVIAVAFGMSVFHLYTAYGIVPTQTLRPIHVGFVLFLCFLVFPVSPRFRHRIMWWDWLAAAAVDRRRRLPAPGRRRLHRPQHHAQHLGHRIRHRA